MEHYKKEMIKDCIKRSRKYQDGYLVALFDLLDFDGDVISKKTIRKHLNELEKAQLASWFKTDYK